MAAARSHAVKCLNKGPGRRRFVFKNFSQRVEEIDIDVFRSLEPVKSQPSDGSSFFRDSLLQWRELNTAEDFISFYEEMLPLVQTLPQILLHREKIFSELLQRLHMGAKLSLEPVLMLLAALSRDILEEFIPYLEQLTESLVNLLKNGGDRDSEVLEQVFSSLSYILMYLQKYLVKDIVHVLKITAHLRFFPKDYVQEFMAEAISFLLRNASMNQLKKGLRKMIKEVARDPSPIKITGVSGLLHHVLRGTSSRLHSRAGKVLQLLIEKSMLSSSEKFPQDTDVVIEVIIEALHRLCEEVNNTDLNIIFSCLREEILSCLGDNCLVHLNRLLALLISTVRFSNESKCFDAQALLELVGLLIQACIVPSDELKSGDHTFEVVNSILQLMICLLDLPLFSRDLSSILLVYAPAFTLKNSSLLTFIKGLLLKDPHIAHAFRSYIISSMDDLIEDATEEVLSLMLTLFERQEKHQHYDVLNGMSRDNIIRICQFLERMFSKWSGLIKNILIVSNDARVSKSQLVVLWGAVSCYPQFHHIEVNLSLLMDLIEVLHQLVDTDADSIAGLSKTIWQCLLGAALASYHKVLAYQNTRLPDTSYFMRFAKRHKSSPQILGAVADFLDSNLGSKSEALQTESIYKEFDGQETVDAINVYSDNLSSPNKGIRIMTLRILSHHAPIVRQLVSSEEHPQKKLKREESGACIEDPQSDKVIELLLSIESTPLSISSSRKVVNLISKIQMDLISTKIYDGYIPLLLHGLIGILHNRFSHLWEPAMQCLTTLLCKYKDLTWNRFIEYFGELQSVYLSSSDQDVKFDSTNHEASALENCFDLFLSPESDSTPCPTLISLFIQSLQKVPDVAESRSRQLIPLFLKFLGYSDDNTLRVESFHTHSLKGKEWRTILKEWLNLLRLMRNARSLFRSQFLKEILVSRLLDEIDPDIQLKVLECLLNWRDDFLIPYDQHLKSLIISKNLREELTTWSVSRESQHIEEGHRSHLIPLVIRLLTPKVRNFKALTSHKHAGVNHRRAVLSFLAQLDVRELQLFFSLVLNPWLANFAKSESLDGEFIKPAEEYLDRFGSFIPVKCLTSVSVTSIPWKRRYGFLHLVEDILRTFDELHVRPFLNPLMKMVVKILESCMLNITTANHDELPDSDIPVGDLQIHATDVALPDSVVIGSSIKQFKDMRSLCMKIIASVLNKYEHHDFGSDFWDIFFVSIKPLIDSFQQEGSSSARPSSLFSCFIIMSQSSALVSLLERGENLVPKILSILTVRTASDAIISSVLSFIENLLDLDNELDRQEDNPVKRVLLPHLEALVFNLHGLFQTHKAAQRKSAIWPGKKELRIFKLLMKYIDSSSVAEQFVDIILPTFRKKVVNTDDSLEGLRIVKGILPVLSNKSTTKVLNGIHPLLVSAGLDLRLCICDLLNGLTSLDPSLSFLAELLQKLNAVSSTEIGEIDYDTRIDAYEIIRPELFSSLKEEHAWVILSQCAYDMQSEELIFRHSASRALLSFIQFAAPILNKDTGDLDEVLSKDEPHQNITNPSAGTRNSYNVMTRACIQRIIKKTFLKNMGEAMTKDTSIQKEWISLLRDMVYNLEGVPALHTFKPLCSEDPEVDFFNNIVHLQTHRKARALARFRNVTSAGFFTEDVTVKIFVPLIFSMLFDLKDGKGEHLRNACLETLSSISGQMQWASYRNFLSRCFKEIALKPEKQKILIRLLCAVLDMFHFYKRTSSQMPKGDVSKVPMFDDMKESSSRSVPSDCLESDISLDVPVRSVPSDCLESDISLDVQDHLQKVVLPQIQKLLTSDSEKVNVNISLAALKLLKLLPLDTMESQLPSLIHRICNFLKNRLESVRDEARSTLAACAKELGLEYLQFIVKVLRATLKRGFELHVLGYTLNFIMSKVLPHPTVGKIDYCLEELFSVVENDVLGDVAEEKEVDKIASKMKETNKSKSFETLKLIAQSVTFRTHALKLVSRIITHLKNHISPKLKAKVEKMLLYVGSGIESNPSAGTEDLLIFVYGLVEDSIPEEGSEGNETYKAGANESSIQGVANKRHTVCPAVHGVRNSHLITVFALGVLHGRLKNMKLNKEDEQLLSMLDPFVKLLGACLNSKYEDILSMTFRCLTPLIRLPLPSLHSQADKIKLLLVDIARRSGNTSSQLFQSCLRLLIVLLQSTRISLSNDQLHMLIHFPMFVDLQINPSPVALSLLKSIIGRKLVVPEIYDVVMHVAELMVTSQSEPVRKKCSQILLQFLLDYRLSEKRLQQHMDFLLTNLSYEHSSGREAVLEMLHAVIVKFPKSLLDSQAQTFFLHLVVALANERDSNVRAMVVTVIKVLIGRSSQNVLHSVLEYSLSWYQGEKQDLWSAAAQVLGLLVEVLKKGFQRHINSVLEVAKGILESSTNVISAKENGFPNEPSGQLWKDSYYSLVMLEKMVLQFPELYLDRNFVGIWKIICKFLLHQHEWLRNISSQLVALYFTAASEASRIEENNLNRGDWFLLKPSNLFLIAVSVVNQLKIRISDIAASNLIPQNLVFSICGLHLFSKQKNHTHVYEYWSRLDTCEQDSYLDAFQLLGSRKARSEFLLATNNTKSCGEKDQNDKDVKEDFCSLLVVPLFKMLGKVAMQVEDIQTKIIFNTFRVISTQLGSEACHEYATHMLLPLYKVCEGYSGRVVSDEVKQVAEEVRDSIRDILGVDNFVQSYNLVRKNLKEKRDKRRHDHKLIAVINPMRHAKRKLQIAAKHRAHKKRKIMAMKERRWIRR